MKLGALRRHKLSLARLFLCSLVGWAGAAFGDAAPGWAQESSAVQEAAAAPAAQLLGPEELRKLVAPVALYPDDLLAIVLPASTNPLQIVQAQRFLDKRKTDQTLQPNSEWDPSILALINYPEVVSKMNADLDWTQALGNAVIDQQKDVMDMIQQIRAETYAGGYLKSNEQQTVVQEKETIIIQSADPQYIYVPTYDPQVVYIDHGPYYSYPPPYYAAPYPYYWSPAATFFAGAFVGAAFGYGFNWGGGDIDINYGSGCCGGGNINTGDINIGNRVDHHTGDRFNADQQRVNGNDKMKWNGNKARQKQATGKQRAARNKAGTLPAKDERNRSSGETNGPATGTGQKQRPGDLKGGNRSTLGNYQSGRDAGKASKQGKQRQQSLQSNRSRQMWRRVSLDQTRIKEKSGAFGGYTAAARMQRENSRGKSSYTTSGRSRFAGRRAEKMTVAIADARRSRAMIGMLVRAWAHACSMAIVLALFGVGVGLLSLPALATEPKTFATPEEAAQALLDAAASDDMDAIWGVLGDEFRDELKNDDAAQERENRRRIVAGAKEVLQLRADDANTRVMVIGNEAWPMPIPIVKGDKGWYFDAAAGADEIIARRIGANELAAVSNLQAYVDAQVQYASADRDSDDVLEYAQRINSSPGKKDGLYWEAPAGSTDEASPFGPFVAEKVAYLPTTILSIPSWVTTTGSLSSGRECPRRPVRLCDQRQHDRWICDDRLASGLRQFRRDDVHRQSERKDLSEGSWRGNRVRRDRTGLRPRRQLVRGQGVEECGTVVGITTKQTVRFRRSFPRAANAPQPARWAASSRGEITCGWGTTIHAARWLKLPPIWALARSFVRPCRQRDGRRGIADDRWPSGETR